MKARLNESENPIEESELVINPDGSIFHLHLLPHQLAETVLLVGDQGRVEQISKNFDSITHKTANREFVAHTGTYKGREITALSTGIGADNIDIVLNELDALVNIDLQTRCIKKEKKSLNLIRIQNLVLVSMALQDSTATCLAKKSWILKRLFFHK
jgi:uridine phosphorylase